MVKLIILALTLRAADFGLLPNHPEINASPIMSQIADSARILSSQGNAVKILLQRGNYYFHEQDSRTDTLFISNHDQPNPRHIGIPLDNLQNTTLDGCGATLIFHGRMLPITLRNTDDCIIKRLSIDFATPHIAQAEVLSVTDSGTVYRMENYNHWTLRDSTLFWHSPDRSWTIHGDFAIAFDPQTHHIIPSTSDLYVQTKHLTMLPDSSLFARGWSDNRLAPGTRLALRSWERPAPAILIDRSRLTLISDVTINYTEGMGVLAQMSEDIDLFRIKVTLPHSDTTRLFTTQADATHFSSCRGHIYVHHSLFESMMDDAINVHGTYLKVISQPSPNTLICRYMHPQTYGFPWGNAGDSVQLITTSTMEHCHPSFITSITPLDTPSVNFLITLDHDITLADTMSYGIENLTWTPTVDFSYNIIRNNRARGSLFSTPRRVTVHHNTFDHTSGSAILLCGDCNGWYESGACRDLTIEHNTFIRPLTSLFQFTRAIISIYPVVPDLDHQTTPFHSGIVIRHNTFITPVIPILYYHSTAPVIFRDNIIRPDYN